MTTEKPTSQKSANAFRTISEVARELDLPQHVLRFWETKFAQIQPMKRGGGRRYYRPEDVALLARIRSLLHDDGYTIKGVQKLLRDGGVRALEAGTASAPSRPDVAHAGASARMPAAAASGGGLSPDVRAEIEGVLGELKGLRQMLAEGAG